MEQVDDISFTWSHTWSIQTTIESSCIWQLSQSRQMRQPSMQWLLSLISPNFKPLDPASSWHFIPFYYINLICKLPVLVYFCLTMTPIYFMLIYIIVTWVVSSPDWCRHTHTNYWFIHVFIFCIIIHSLPYLRHESVQVFFLGFQVFFSHEHSLAWYFYVFIFVIVKLIIHQSCSSNLSYLYLYHKYVVHIFL